MPDAGTEILRHHHAPRAVRVRDQVRHRFVDDPPDAHGLRGDVVDERVQAVEVTRREAARMGVLMERREQDVRLWIETRGGRITHGAGATTRGTAGRPGRFGPCRGTGLGGSG